MKIVHVRKAGIRNGSNISEMNIVLSGYTMKIVHVRKAGIQSGSNISASRKCKRTCAVPHAVLHKNTSVSIPAHCVVLPVGEFKLLNPRTFDFKSYILN